MGIYDVIADDLNEESIEYWRTKDIDTIFQSIATGLAYNKPDDPLQYITDCCSRIARKELGDSKKLQWNSFVALPPIPSAPKTIPLKGKRIQDPPMPVVPLPVGNLKGSRNSVLAPIAAAATDAPCKSKERGKAWSNIVFILGGPGSGKGTQCSRIAKEFNYIHLSAGDLLRAEVAKGSGLGKQIDILIQDGSIVPTYITLRLLKEAMENAEDANGFLIDGFPRQLDQAEAFEKEVAKCKFVLYFECSQQVLEKRLLKRGETSGRSDDNMESIKKRFKTFQEISFPVIEAFKKRDKCVVISSEPPVDKVYEIAKKYFEPPPLLYHNNIVFVLGGPGSGKGTQCAKLVAEFGLTHLSTGDLLRAEVENGTAIGKEAEALMKEGKMVPVSVVLGLVRKTIENNINSPGFLIDGYPRAMDQAIEFENTIGPCRLVLFFNCPLKTLEERLLERGKTSGRADDNIETIKKRFKTFETQSIPVIEHFKTKGKCVEISSEAPVSEVYSTAREFFVRPEKLSLKNLVFVLGGPGSGKGTQCEKLASTYGYTHISTGDILRAEVKNKTPIGVAAQECMQKGAMVPMSIILQLLINTLKENRDSAGFLIDGFPRAMDQALEFERLIGEPSLVLHFYCPMETLEKRLLERGKTSGRADDNIDTILLRFKTYENESLPVINYYQSKYSLVKISSAPSIDDVFETARMHFEPKPFDGEKIVFVLGGPGSGKGTQCDKLSGLGYAHISTGDLLRDEVKKGTPLGVRLESDMKEGKMISLDITMNLLKQAMEAKRGAPGYLIDGFPRTMEQAKVFERVIGKCSFVLFFEASHATLTERLLERGKTSGRADDNIESIIKRLTTFTETSLPVIHYFSADGRVKKINAEGSIHAITEETMAHFNITSN